MARASNYKPSYMVAFYTDGDLNEPKICYFQTKKDAKALYDSLAESEIIWKISMSKVEEYQF